MQFTLNINNNKPSQSKIWFAYLSLGLISVFLLLSFLQPGYLEIDGSIFSSVALKISKGGTLYVDAWDNKPPGIFYLIALFYAFVPNNVYALFVMSYIFLIINVFCLFFLIQRALQTVLFSVLFCSIALVFILNHNIIMDGLFTEIYGTAFVLSSWVFLIVYQEKRKNKFLYLSFLLLGFSFWFKEPFIFVALALLAYYFFKIKQNKLFFKGFLFFLMPSGFFVVLLLINHSLLPFIEIIKYNFYYIEDDKGVNYMVKVDSYVKHLLRYFYIWMVPLFLFLFRIINEKKHFLETVLLLGIFLSSTLFVFISPYDFGHYYFPSFVLFFLIIVKFQELFNLLNRSNILIFYALTVYTLYKINDLNLAQFKYEMEPYKEDVITQHLKKEKNKTLFVAFVEQGSYYVKSDCVFPTFLPLELPLHFRDNLKGKQNSVRFWKNLRTNHPDYIIKNYAEPHFDWYIADSNFITLNYHLVDSSVVNSNRKAFLYRLNQIKK